MNRDEAWSGEHNAANPSTPSVPPRHILPLMLPTEPENVARRPSDHAASDDAPAPVEVNAHSEREVPNGWSFTLNVRRDTTPAGTPADPSSEHEIRLSWADYEYWSHGTASPSRVAEAVVRGTLQLVPDLNLPARFDASTCRRRAGGKALDEWVRANI